MFLSIPLFVGYGIAQAKIRRQVDDPGSQFCILLDMALRLAVRLGQEQQVHRLQHGRIAEFELCLFPQVGMDLVHILPQMRARRHLPHIDIGVAQQ